MQCWLQYYLDYPFHSEAIVWVLGRGASIACAAGLSALLFLVSDLPERVKILGLSLCYFIGLAAYESITLLPLLVLVVLNSRHASWLNIPLIWLLWDSHWALT